MRAQHTPGPWDLIKFGGPQIGNRQSGEAVCTMWGSENDPADPFHANARLITAAPELLEACIRGRAALARAVIANSDGLLDEETVGEHLVVKELDAAIAKARGGQ